GRELERDDAAAGREGPREPDRAVPAERAELEDPPRAADPSEEVEELPLGRRDVDRRQARGRVRLERGGERVVRRGDRVGEVTVDLRPALVGHAPEATRARSDDADDARHLADFAGVNARLTGTSMSRLTGFLSSREAGDLRPPWTASDEPPLRRR